MAATSTKSIYLKVDLVALPSNKQDIYTTFNIVMIFLAYNALIHSFLSPSIL